MIKSKSKSLSKILVLASIIVVTVFALIFRDITLYSKSNPEIRIFSVEKIDSKTNFFNEDSKAFNKTRSFFLLRVV